MRVPFIVVLFSTSLTSFVASSVAATVELPKYGFQIDLLDAAPQAGFPAQAIMSFLPPQDGFSPNVNVVIQPYAGTIEDYASLSKGQFDQMKWTVISERTISDSEWVCEYSGSMHQALLHWYARAILKSGNVYLVTATAADVSWKSVAEALKKSVDSVVLK